MGLMFSPCQPCCGETFQFTLTWCNLSPFPPTVVTFTDPGGDAVTATTDADGQIVPAGLKANTLYTLSITSDAYGIFPRFKLNGAGNWTTQMFTGTVPKTATLALDNPGLYYCCSLPLGPVRKGLDLRASFTFTGRTPSFNPTGLAFDRCYPHVWNIECNQCADLFVPFHSFSHGSWTFPMCAQGMTYDVPLVWDGSTYSSNRFAWFKEVIDQYQSTFNCGTGNVATMSEQQETLTYYAKMIFGCGLSLQLANVIENVGSLTTGQRNFDGTFSTGVQNWAYCIDGENPPGGFVRPPIGSCPGHIPNGTMLQPTGWTPLNGSILPANYGFALTPQPGPKFLATASGFVGSAYDGALTSLVTPKCPGTDTAVLFVPFGEILVKVYEP
jgi:hypothetical protein